MPVLIGEAAYDERHKLTGGTPGDQTGEEVRIRAYADDFTVLYRCKDPAKHTLIAEAMTQACQNLHIGYDQNDRYSLYYAMMKTGNISLIKTDCNTDCSALVACCCIIAGIPVSRFMYTAIEDQVLMRTGEFERITGFAAADLQKGDILWRSGHTAVIVQAAAGAVPYSRTPKYVGKILRLTKVYEDDKRRNMLSAHAVLGIDNLVDVCDETAELYYVRISGQFYGFVEKKDLKKVMTEATTGTITTALNVRSGPGTGNRIVFVAAAGATCKIIDTAAAPNGDKWYKITVANATGYVNAKYVKETK